MNNKKLNEFLKKADDNGLWAFSTFSFYTAFPEEDRRSIIISLRRHVEAGNLLRVSKGVYVNSSARSMPEFPLAHLLHLLKPHSLFYLSLESVLSEEGLISQIPNRLTLITNGRSQTFNTSLGIVEFVHSTKNAELFLKNTKFDKFKGIHVASVKLAKADMKRTRRSLDLLEETERKMEGIWHL